MQSLFGETGNNDSDDVSLRVMFNEYYYLLRISLFYPKFDKYYKILSVLLMIIYYILLVSHICFFVITICLSNGDFILMATIFNYTIVTIFFLYLQIDTLICRSHIRDIHEIIGNNENIYENDSDEKIKIIKYNHLNFKKKVKLLIPMINICCSSFVLIIGPIIDRLTDQAEKETYSESGINLVLPVHMWYPFEAHQGINFFIGSILQTILIIVLSSFLQSVGSLYVVASINIAMHLELLKHSLKTIEIRSLKLFNKVYGKSDQKLQSKHLYTNDNFMKCMDHCLKINIRHHLDNLRLTKHLNRWAKYILAVTVGMGAIMVALSAFLVTSGKAKPGGLIISLLMCAGQVFYILCICYFGQNITDMNRKVNLAIFYMSCYKYPKKFNKSVKIMQTFTCQDVAIKSIFNFTADMETFGKILNTAYSYTSLLFAWNS